MNARFSRLRFALACCAIVTLASARATPAPSPEIRTARPVRFAVSPPVSQMPAATPSPGRQAAAAAVREIPLLAARDPAALSTSGDADGARQPLAPTAAMPAPILTFEGLGNDAGVLPPDPAGDIGPNHYVEAVNLRFRVFDRTGTPLTPVLKISSLFAALGGPAATYDDGDPIVLYDPLADRWLISQFVISVTPCHEVIAISQTGDPTGAYYLYDFIMPGNNVNDYPHFGVWPDAYYMTDNQFESSSFAWRGAGVFAFDRARMLAGDAGASYIYFDLYPVNPGLGGLLPADLDGPPPPAGTPNYFACLTANEWGDPQDGLRIFEFHPDFATPAASTFTQSQSIAVAPFDPNFSGGRDNVAQPGTTEKLDAIADRLMYRLQYRHFPNGGYEALVVNHTVDENGADHAGVRSYELRRALPGGAFYMHDQTTYAPDADHRWMGSSALDADGNLALGFSVSGTSTFPSIRYVGRKATDAGGFTFSEATLYAGSGSQTHSASRWGDYTMLTVDPTDDGTFWYINEYYPATSSAGWHTRIGCFRFPGTLPAPLATITGAVIDAESGLPISNAIVRAVAAGYLRATDGGGAYRMTVYPDSYTLAASAAGYIASTGVPVAVANGAVGAAVFALTRIAPDVTPATAFAAAGPPGGPYSPTSKVYAVTNPGAGSVTWTATWSAAWLSVEPAGGTLAPGASTAVVMRISGGGGSLPLGTHTDAVIFSNLVSGVTVVREARLSITLAHVFTLDEDPGWTRTGLWAYGPPLGSGGDPASGHTGPNVFGYNLAGQYENGIASTYWLTTPALNCAGLAQTRLRFWRWLGVESATWDHAYVQVSSDGLTWSTVWQNSSTSIDDGSWYFQDLSISAVADGKPTVYIRWGMGSTDGSVTYCGWNIDDIEVTGVFPEMALSSTNGLAGSGYLYGPFTPDATTYTVSNGWTGPLAWTTICAAAWIEVSPPGGTLPIGGTESVRAAFSPAAYELPPGTYRDTLVFSNMASGYALSVPVELTVSDIPALQFTLDSDPGWARQGEWAFGQPAGHGGAGGGMPDPAAGATGSRVFGVNLNGDYSTAVGGPYYLTAGPFDFRAYTNVALQFERWLNSDVQPFAYATLELSTNGTDWAPLWQNPLNPNAANHPNKPIPRTSPTTDSAWTRVRYDVASLADHQQTVYVRWGYQVGNYALAYSGWNIDDIVFTGGATGAALVVYPESAAFAGDSGGPFTPGDSTFTIKNMGEGPLDWSAAASNAWLTLSPAGGTLAAHGYTNVVVTLTAAADALPPGLHTCDIICSNLSAGTALTRPVRLTAVAVPGVLSISDSIAPPDDRLVPFGSAFVGTISRQRIAVTNSDPLHSLVVSNIVLYQHYAEDFDDGLAQGWQEDVGADWTVTNGEYRAAAAGDGWMMSAYTGQTWSNGFAEVSCRRAGPVGNAAAVVLRASSDFDPDGTGSGYIFEISQTSYGVWKQVNGAWTWLRIWNASPVISNGVNTIRATATGNQLRLYVNGTLLWSGSDSSIASGRAGLAGFRTAGDCVHYFDGFRAGDERLAPDHFAIEGDPATPAVLAPGEGFAFDALFRPAATGALQSLVWISSDDRATPLAPVSLTGTGLPDHLGIEPSTRFDAAGHPGGPFAPASAIYVVSNRSGSACDWTAAAGVPWLTLTPATGSLAAGDHVAVTATINAVAATLPEGIESGSVDFSNAVTGAVQSRPVRLTVYRSPEIALAPPALYVTQRLGYAAASGSFAVANSGDDTLTAGLTSAVAWLELDATAVTVAAGTSAVVGAAVDAGDLVPGAYSGSVAVPSNDRTDPLTNLTVHLTVLPNEFSVLPSGGLAGSGPEAGPFTPSGKVYTVDNTGDTTFDWAATADDPSWLVAAPASGTLPAGTGVSVQVAFGAAASALPPGVYSNRVVFSNSASAYSTTRDVALIVLAPGAGPGQIAIVDSDEPATNRSISFGRVTLGDSLTHHIAITNIDLTNSLVVGEIALSEGYVEDFNDGIAQEWTEDLDDNWSVVNGEYRSASAATDFMTTVFRGGWWTNVAAEISVHRSGATTTSAGLALRASDDFDADGIGSAYIFQISGQGSFLVWKQVAGVQTIVQDWTSSTAIRTTGNYLAASVSGNTLRMFVNGTLVWQGTDSSLSEGRIGLTGYTDPSNISTHYFDYVRVGGPLTWGVLSPEQQRANAAAQAGSSPAFAPEATASSSAAGTGVSPQETPLVSIMPTNYALANVPPLPFTLGPGTGVTVDVIFRPAARGVHRALAIVGSDDADELRIPVALTGTGTPATVSLTSDAGPNGTITPSGLVVVAYDASPAFVVKGAPYYHVGAIATNGGAVPGAGGPAVTNWTWHHATDDGSVYATFSENRTSRGTPEWWLAEHGLTNGIPGSEEQTDVDGDGAQAWSEFFAGTDPEDGSSVLEIADLRVANGLLILRWPSTTNAIVLPYAIERAAGLAPGGSWTRIGPTLSRTPPTNQWTVPGWSTNLSQHYRITVSTNGW